jgi:hypothetical protein
MRIWTGVGVGIGGRCKERRVWGLGGCGYGCKIAQRRQFDTRMSRTLLFQLGVLVLWDIGMGMMILNHGADVEIVYIKKF